jgi:RNA polymerase sigma-70 factor, ECF subfamily
MIADASDSLLSAAQAGDRAALERLLAVHRDTVFRYGLRFCKTSEDAEDAVQETLWAATKSIASFRRAAAVTTWLFTIVRNKCHRLTHRWHADPSLADVLPYIPESADTPEERLLIEQVQLILSNALAKLDAAQREVILLRDVEGLTAPEAAHRLDLTVQALKSRLHRARSQLREAIGGLQAADAHSGWRCPSRK